VSRLALPRIKTSKAGKEGKPFMPETLFWACADMRSRATD